LLAVKSSIYDTLTRERPCFEPRGKLYIADFVCDGQVHVTKAYTNVEDEKARQAYELIRNGGFASYQEAMHLVQDGHFAHLPVLSAADVDRAYELYRVHPKYVRGEMVKKKALRAVIDDNLILGRKKQTPYTDAMHIGSTKFRVMV
jgi:hypothetical protein